MSAEIANNVIKQEVARVTKVNYTPTSLTTGPQAGAELTARTDQKTSPKAGREVITDSIITMDTAAKLLIRATEGKYIANDITVDGKVIVSARDKSGRLRHVSGLESKFGDLSSEQIVRSLMKTELLPPATVGRDRGIMSTLKPILQYTAAGVGIGALIGAGIGLFIGLAFASPVVFSLAAASHLVAPVAFGCAIGCGIVGLILGLDRAAIGRERNWQGHIDHFKGVKQLVSSYLNTRDAESEETTESEEATESGATQPAAPSVTKKTDASEDIDQILNSDINLTLNSGTLPTLSAASRNRPAAQGAPKALS